MMRVLAGLDIGTSSAKAVLMDEHGQTLGWSAQEVALLSPKPGWAEQEAGSWLEAAALSLRTAMHTGGVDARQVEAIGLSGQMHGLVCLAEDGARLRPAIIWADQRSAAQVERLVAHIGIQRLAEWSGNPLATGFMLSSWVWLQENEPHIAQNTRWLMLPKDEVRYRLTGQIGSEPSDASSTSLFDPHRTAWSAPLLQWAGLSPAQMPPIFASSQPAGKLLPEMAQACGLRPGIPVVHGCSDQAAQALSQGVIRPGSVSCTIGTGGQLFAPLDRPVHDPDLRLHLFCHALPDCWHLEAAILSAGLALRWLRDQLWQGSTYQQLADQASQVEAANEGLFFLPHLVGERTPHMDPAARAAFLGLTLRHQRPHLVRAVMEGVVFALRQGLELMIELGTPVEEMVASGGATQHPLWLQLQADIFNRAIFPSPGGEGAARGAAMLAGVGAGVFQDAAQAVRQTVAAPEKPVLPNLQRVEMYAQTYEQYRRWYPALKSARL